MTGRRALPRAVVVTGAIAGLMAAAPKLLTRALRPEPRPMPHTPDKLGLPAEQITLESRTGTRLHAWFIPAEGRAPAVIVMHGWTANASLMLPLGVPLRRLGLHLLFLDGRGHGLSEPDELTGAPQFAEDIEAALDWLAQDPRVEAAAVLGHSAGATAAILAASRRPEVAAVVSVAAIADPRAIRWGRLPKALPPLLMRYLAWRTGYELSEIIPLERAAHVRAPMLLIHGDADEVVPVEHAHQLAERADRAELLVVPGAGHASLEAFESTGPAVGEFLSRHLLGREAPAER
jgi:pimeloyl-ACP methyl ester carboxylesterase